MQRGEQDKMILEPKQMKLDQRICECIWNGMKMMIPKMMNTVHGLRVLTHFKALLISIGDSQ